MFQYTCLKSSHWAGWEKAGDIQNILSIESADHSVHMISKNLSQIRGYDQFWKITVLLLFYNKLKIHTRFPNPLHAASTKSLDFFLNLSNFLMQHPFDATNAPLAAFSLVIQSHR